MPERTDPGPDPRFPDRPDHPHFRLLSDLIQELNGLPGALPEKGPKEWFEDEQIDERSVVYMASQRVVRIVQMTPPDRTLQMMTAQLDGFMLGYLFALSRTDR